MTKSEKEFNELLPEYKEAYKTANGKEVDFNIYYKSGRVYMPGGYTGTIRLSQFKNMLNTLKKRAQNKGQ